MLTIAIGYAVVTGGGDRPLDSSGVLLLVGLAGVFGAGLLFTSEPAPRRDDLLDVAALAFPIYVAAQLVPLPLRVLMVLSPARAQLAQALGAIVGDQVSAPISISPATTWMHLWRVAGCSIVFLLVRRVARRSAGSGWAAAVPLIGVGAFAAAMAYFQAPTNEGPISGAYANRNHFANLLAMTLPFALAAAAVLLARGKRPADAGALGCVAALIACAAALFAATLLSFSKGGVLAMLASLATMAAIGLGRKRSGLYRTSLVAGLGLLIVLALVFLAPIGLVERFSSVSSADPTEGRLPILKDALHLVAAYPMVGVGLGNFYPALMPYQTQGFNVAWVHTHNDYVQLLSELGIVGWSIPVVLISLVFWRALRVAGGDASPDVRLLGLACVGGLTVFLIHSFSEFNSYVLSNAVVFSWIAGLSAGLPSMNGWRSTPGANAWPVRRVWLRPIVLVLACFTVAASAGRIVFVQAFQNDPVVEQKFCRLGICDTEGAITALQRGPDEAVAMPVPVNDLLRYLQREPAAPDRWEYAGEALQRKGRTREARYAFAQAVNLAPRDPIILLMAADFHFDLGEEPAALDLVARGLRESDVIDNAAFADLEYRETRVDDVLQRALPDRRSARAYFDRLLRTGGATDLVVAWEWMLSHQYADDELANGYVASMIGHKEPEAAARGWALYTGNHGTSYPAADAVFNGGFESDPTGNRFDWKLEPARAGQIDFDDTVRQAGSRSLRIRFDGTRNPRELGVEEAVFVRPGRYRFRAYLRTEGVSTDQGVHFRIVSGNGPKSLEIETEDFRGSHDWTLVEREFDALPGGLLRVMLVRKPSLKFDSNVAGTAWADSVSLTRME